MEVHVYMYRCTSIMLWTHLKYMYTCIDVQVLCYEHTSVAAPCLANITAISLNPSLQVRKSGVNPFLVLHSTLAFLINK